jgi:hypothetical protein
MAISVLVSPLHRRQCYKIVYFTQTFRSLAINRLGSMSFCMKLSQVEDLVISSRCGARLRRPMIMTSCQITKREFELVAATPKAFSVQK